MTNTHSAGKRHGTKLYTDYKGQDVYAGDLVCHWFFGFAGRAQSLTNTKGRKRLDITGQDVGDGATLHRSVKPEKYIRCA